MAVRSIAFAVLDTVCADFAHSQQTEPLRRFEEWSPVDRRSVRSSRFIFHATSTYVILGFKSYLMRCASYMHLPPVLYPFPLLYTVSTSESLLSIFLMFHFQMRISCVAVPRTIMLRKTIWTWRALRHQKAPPRPLFCRRSRISSSLCTTL